MSRYVVIDGDVGIVCLILHLQVSDGLSLGDVDVGEFPTRLAENGDVVSAQEAFLRNEVEGNGIAAVGDIASDSVGEYVILILLEGRMVHGAGDRIGCGLIGILHQGVGEHGDHEAILEVGNGIGAVVVLLGGLFVVLLANDAHFHLGIALLIGGNIKVSREGTVGLHAGELLQLIGGRNHRAFLDLLLQSANVGYARRTAGRGGLGQIVAGGESLGKSADVDRLAVVSADALIQDLGVGVVQTGRAGIVTRSGIATGSQTAGITSTVVTLAAGKYGLQLGQSPGKLIGVIELGANRRGGLSVGSLLGGRAQNRDLGIVRVTLPYGRTGATAAAAGNHQIYRFIAARTGQHGIGEHASRTAVAVGSRVAAVTGRRVGSARTVGACPTESKGQGISGIQVHKAVGITANTAGATRGGSNEAVLGRSAVGATARTAVCSPGLHQVVSGLGSGKAGGAEFSRSCVGIEAAKLIFRRQTLGYGLLEYEVGSVVVQGLLGGQIVVPFVAVKDGGVQDRDGDHAVECNLLLVFRSALSVSVTGSRGRRNTNRVVGRVGYGRRFRGVITGAFGSLTSRVHRVLADVINEIVLPAGVAGIIVGRAVLGNVQIGDLEGGGLVSRLQGDHLGVGGHHHQNGDVDKVGLGILNRLDDPFLAGILLQRDGKIRQKGDVIASEEARLGTHVEVHRQKDAVAGDRACIDVTALHLEGAGLLVVGHGSVEVCDALIVEGAVGTGIGVDVKVLGELTLHHHGLQIFRVDLGIILGGEQSVAEGTALGGGTTTRAVDLVLTDGQKLHDAVAEGGCQEGGTTATAADIGRPGRARHDTARAAAVACATAAAAPHTVTARTGGHAGIVRAAPVVGAGLGFVLAANRRGRFSGDVGSRSAHVGRGGTRGFSVFTKEKIAGNGISAAAQLNGHTVFSVAAGAAVGPLDAVCARGVCVGARVTGTATATACGDHYVVRQSHAAGHIPASRLGEPGGIELALLEEVERRVTSAATDLVGTVFTVSTARAVHTAARRFPGRNRAVGTNAVGEGLTCLQVDLGVYVAPCAAATAGIAAEKGLGLLNAGPLTAPQLEQVVSRHLYGEVTVTGRGSVDNDIGIRQGRAQADVQPEGTVSYVRDGLIDMVMYSVKVDGIGGLCFIIDCRFCAGHLQG